MPANKKQQNIVREIVHFRNFQAESSIIPARNGWGAVNRENFISEYDI